MLKSKRNSVAALLLEVWLPFVLLHCLVNRFDVLLSFVQHLFELRFQLVIHRVVLQMLPCCSPCCHWSHRRMFFHLNRCTPSYLFHLNSVEWHIGNLIELHVNKDYYEVRQSHMALKRKLLMTVRTSHFLLSYLINTVTTISIVWLFLNAKLWCVTARDVDLTGYPEQH